MKYLINRCITKWIHTVNTFVNLLIEFVKLNFNHGYPKINLEIDYDGMVEEFALLSAHNDLHQQQLQEIKVNP